MHTRPLSAALLRRLGEAADGYRTGRPIYVVACYDHPRDDLRIFDHEADALEHLSQAGDRFGMFGPFVTHGAGADGLVREVAITLRAADGSERVARLDGREYDAFLWSASAIDKFAVPYYAATAGIDAATEMRQRCTQGPVCWMTHRPGSIWGSGVPDQPDVPEGEPDGYVSPEAVTTVTLLLHDGREIRLDGREHDAVFWSPSAIDKFAVPYYARTDGPEFAAEMRRQAARSSFGGITHMPRSEYETDGIGGDAPGFESPAGPGEVVEVAVQLRAASGAERTIRLDGREYDAFLWSASAIDKFAVPYYARTDGPEHAAEMRRRCTEGAVCWMTHRPGSVWSSGVPDQPEVPEGEPDGYAPPEAVITVTLVLLDGREIHLDGREHDAVFWTLSAVDKFAVPYYARTDGPEFAAEMRRRAARSSFGGIAHLPRSDYVPDGTGHDPSGFEELFGSTGRVVETAVAA